MYINPIKVGDKFILKCGTVVTVTGQLENSPYYSLEDAKGNKGQASATKLKRGNVYWVFPPTYPEGTKVWLSGADRGFAKPVKLSPYPTGYYVYFAIHNGVVVYIGKGTQGRCAHVNSGCSANRELNRLYFAGEKVSIVFHTTDLEEHEALQLEVQLIREMQPMCNLKLK